MQLSPEQKRFWNESGYIILKGIFSAEETEELAEIHQQIWTQRSADQVLDDLDDPHRLDASMIPAGKSQMRYKINDLYLNSAVVRQAALRPRIVEVLSEVLVDRPVLINSLDVDYGTQQDRHIDTLFMTPPAPYNLAAAWVALEDVHPDAGPLFYYPGSHVIEPYRFSDGTNHVIGEEMDSWYQYMDEQIVRFGLERREFLAERGDVFIWNGYLLHGGAQSTDRERTRKSVIFHYFGESVCRSIKQDLRPLGDGLWSHRNPVRTSEFEANDRRSFERLRMATQRLVPKRVRSRVERTQKNASEPSSGA